MTPKATRIAFLIFFGMLVALFFYMAAPLMQAAFLALIVAIIFNPVNKFLFKLFRQHNYAASITTTFLSFLVVMVPLILIIALIASNLVEFVAQLLQRLQSGQLVPVIDHLEKIINGWLAALPGAGDHAVDLKATIINFLKSVAAFLYQFSPQVLATTAKLGINLAVFVIFLVVFFAEGSTLFAWFLRSLPLSASHQEEISREIRIMISAILLGMIVTALIQGFLIGLGFWISGFNDPLMWGLIAVLAAFIPIVGAASCYLGASIVLAAVGKWHAAIIFLLYGVVIVSSVDNIMKPFIMRGRTRVHAVLLFIALLGGVRAFGPIGIVFGPVLLAVFLASLRIYQREFAA